MSAGERFDAASVVGRFIDRRLSRRGNQLSLIDTDGQGGALRFILLFCFGLLINGFFQALPLVIFQPGVALFNRSAFSFTRSISGIPGIIFDPYS